MPAFSSNLLELPATCLLSDIDASVAIYAVGDSFAFAMPWLE